MAARVVVDAGVLIALLSGGDRNHSWAVSQAVRTPPPWSTCEAALSEAFHLLWQDGAPEYHDVPMSLADACLVRLSETLPDPVVVTTDTDFRIYRRHSRQVVPCLLP